MKLSLYLAARFSRAKELAAYADILNASGNFLVLSSWHHTPHAEEPHFNDRDWADFYAHIAAKDLAEIRLADYFVAFTEDPQEAFKRGGRHIETGYALALGKPIVTVGPVETIFHTLPNVHVVPDWEGLQEWLNSTWLYANRNA